MRSCLFRVPTLRVFRPAVMVVLLCGCLVFNCPGANPFSKGPYIQFPTPGTVTILWEGASPDAGSVRLLSDGMPERTSEKIVPVEKRSQTSGQKSSTNATFYLYKASFTGLKPATRYSYSVELQGTQTPIRQFRTLDSEATQTRFIVYGDSRSDPKKHAALTEKFEAYSPDFILHTGDLVAKGQDYSLWSREFFGPTANVIDHIPFFSVIGNHEQDGTNYLNYFDLPGNKLWYSFDVGPVHILALDFRSDKRTQQQFEFARQDLLNSRATWKIVTLHTPVYNIGGHASDWGHADYLPLFHATKVDIILAGHSHMYERFRPLAPKKSKSNWCITHITTGGGGASLHTALAHPALVTQETTNHFMVFEATPGTLRGTAIRVDGSLIDTFEIKKSSGRLNQEYLTQAYTEESLNLFYETIPMLVARAGGLPTASSPADIQFRVPARSDSASRAKLEISLTPEASSAYELIDGPLRVTTAARGKTNIVWAKVRSIGSTPIRENSSRELTPALAFQARVKAPEGETLAYGAKTRVASLVPTPPTKPQADTSPSGQERVAALAE